MKQNIYLFILLATLTVKCSAQHKDSTFLGKSWIIESSINMLTPTHKYVNSFRPQGIDGLGGSFDAVPSFTADNVSVKAGYKWPLFVWEKTNWELSTTFAYQHLHLRNTETGADTGGIVYTYFKGTIINNYQIEYATANAEFSCHIKAGKHIDICSGVNIGIGNWAHSTFYNTVIGASSNIYYSGPISNSVKEGMWNNTMVHHLLAYTDFSLGTIFQLYKPVFLKTQLELPLFLINSGTYYSYSPPYSSIGEPNSGAPYFSSIDQLYYINFSIEVICKL